VVAVIGNDGQRGQIKRPQQAMLGHGSAGDLAPGIRSDRMVEALGGYGELVERPAQIRPAIERALASGLPKCVNVLIDPSVAYARSTQAAVYSPIRASRARCRQGSWYPTGCRLNM
jgi:acetolactate synthase I/II/III large subunit